MRSLIQAYHILIHWTQKRQGHIDVGNPGPGLGQTQRCGGVKPVTGIPILPSW